MVVAAAAPRDGRVLPLAPSSVFSSDARRGRHQSAGAEAPLAKAAMEAVAFSGLENLPFDVSFLKGREKLVEIVIRQGQPLLFPERPAKKLSSPSIPGGDPSKPPQLR